MRQRYGIEVEEYAGLLEEQQGRCAICHQAEGSRAFLSVDHDHDTGAVRGLLCNRCNIALGGFGDSLERLRAAVAYLESAVARAPHSAKSLVEV